MAHKIEFPEHWKKAALSFEQTLGRKNLWLFPPTEETLCCMRVPIQGIEVIAGVTQSKKTLIQAKLTIGLQSTKIFRQTFLSRLGTFTGLIDVSIGDKNFDERFVIRTNNRHITQYLLSAEVRSAIEKAEGFHFEVEGEALIASLDGDGENAQTIMAGVRAVAAIAAREHALYQEWRSLAEELGAELTPQPKTHHVFGHSLTVKHQGLTFSIRHPQNQVGYRLPAMMTTRIVAKAETEVFRISSEEVGDLVEAKKLSSHQRVFSKSPEITLRRITLDIEGFFTEEMNLLADGKEIRVFIEGLVLSPQKIRDIMALMVGLLD
jgi:hypothetical protein